MTTIRHNQYGNHALFIPLTKANHLERAFSFHGRDVICTTLPNGLSVVLVPQRSPLISASLIVDAGFHEDVLAGTATILEDLLSPPLHKTPIHPWFGWLSKTGQLSDRVTTTPYCQHYHVESFLEHAGLLLRGLFGMVYTTPNNPEDFEALRKQHLEDLTQEDPESKRYNQFLLQALYPKDKKLHICAHGTKESLHKISLGDVKKFHDRWYHPHNMLLVVTGSLKMSTLQEFLKEAMTAIPKKKLSLRPERPTYLPKIVAHSFPTEWNPQLEFYWTGSRTRAEATLLQVLKHLLLGIPFGVVGEMLSELNIHGTVEFATEKGACPLTTMTFYVEETAFETIKQGMREILLKICRGDFPEEMTMWAVNATRMEILENTQIMDASEFATLLGDAWMLDSTIEPLDMSEELAKITHKHLVEGAESFLSPEQMGILHMPHVQDHFLMGNGEEEQE